MVNDMQWKTEEICLAASKICDGKVTQHGEFVNLSKFLRIYVTDLIP